MNPGGYDRNAGAPLLIFDHDTDGEKYVPGLRITERGLKATISAPSRSWLPYHFRNSPPLLYGNQRAPLAAASSRDVQANAVRALAVSTYDSDPTLRAINGFVWKPLLTPTENRARNAN